MKICSCCLTELDFSKFSNKADSKDGKSSQCKSCLAVKKKKYYEDNRGEMLSKLKKYRDSNKQKVSDTKKASRLKKIDEYLGKARQRYYDNREQILKADKEKRKANLEQYKKKERATYTRHAEKKSAYQRAFYQRNKERLSKYKAEYDRKRYKTDALFALARTVRRRMSLAIQRAGYIKSQKTEEMLGCTLSYMKDHLEKQFTSGMNWENRGKWHVDHIIPLSSAKTEDELIGLCHFTNLRPLWAEENLKKGARVEVLI